MSDNQHSSAKTKLSAEPKRQTRTQRYQRRIGHLYAELARVEDFTIDLLGVIDANALKLPLAIEQQRRELEFPLPGEAT